METVLSFDFIKDTQKYNALVKANESLNIHKGNHNTIVFIYTPPKVGSTSIVSSLRLFGSHLFDIIHIHDEEMLRVLAHVDGITINELILFNKYLGKQVYVIDIYRSPIERKISTFFEKIGSYHFNNTDKKVNEYNVKKIIHRFNNIFNHLAIGDHFIDNYNIKIPEHFDWDKKYLLVEENGIHYIKLRLKDSNLWGSILTTIFQKNIFIIKDYETNNKPIKDVFQSFKSQYKIPINFLNEIMNCKYLNYYYSPEEKSQYYNDWNIRSSDAKDGYTLDQYRLYEEITLENAHIDYVQLDHYMDEGCMCRACGLKRAEIASKIARGIHTTQRVIHTQAKTELIHKRVGKVNRINNAIQRINLGSKNRKDFNGEMINIVNGNR
jgi:hypothetical protein